MWCSNLDDEDNEVRTEKEMQCVHIHTAQHRFFSGCLTLSGVIRCQVLHSVTHLLTLNPQLPSLRVGTLPLDHWSGLITYFKLRMPHSCASNWDFCVNCFIRHRPALTHVGKTFADDQNPVQPLIYSRKGVKRIAKEWSQSCSQEVFEYAAWERWIFRKRRNRSFSGSVLPSSGNHSVALSLRLRSGSLKLKP